MKHSPRVEISAFLALDQASVSGVALAGFRDGRMHAIQSGTATKAEHRVRTVHAAIQRGGCTCLVVRPSPPTYPCPCTCGAIKRLAVVLEDHSKIPASAGYGTITLLGMGAARGEWTDTLEHMGHPEHMRFWVDMATWRTAVLGPRFARVKKEVAKPEAVRWAQARTGRTDIGDDEAEALCILHWAASNIPQKLARERLQRDLAL